MSLDERHLCHDEVFLDLLEDLSPLLKTPLLILEVINCGFEASGQTWIVQPGTKEVQTTWRMTGNPPCK
jgi:hypothetical protein